MRVRLPSKEVREKFLLVYELKGCQEAVNYLTKHYGVRPMRIILKGRRVGNGDIAVYCYGMNRAYFTKKGLTKQTVLHELYHHLAYVSRLEMSNAKEERAANGFARDFLS